MRANIAKLLVFFMLVTTVIVPANYSFAEEISGGDQVVQQDSRNESNSESSTTEIETNKTNDTQSTSDDNLTNQEKKEIVEDVNDEMKFLYIESQELESPGTQNIAVSWKEDITDIEKMILVYEDSKGNQYEINEKNRTDNSILFTKDFTSRETGEYTIKGVKFYIDGTENYFEFDDVEIGAKFSVVNNIIDSEDVSDETVVVDIDTDGTIDKNDINSQMKAALLSANEETGVLSRSAQAKKSDIVVVLDPGHGGSDSGAVRNKTIYEKTLNLKVAQYCKAELEQYGGVKVYMTRTGDTYLTLAQRAQIAKDYGANILVSIHQNSGSNTRGAEVYYPNSNYRPALGSTGKGVASNILTELTKLGLTNRGTKIRNTANGSTYADGSYSDYYGVIRESKERNVAAIIVEHAFLSNTNDYNQFLSSDAKLKQLGVADATGIAKYFGLSKGQWVQDSNGWKYKNGDGTYKTNELYTINGNVYYFDEDGYRYSGFKDINGSRYYFGADGKAKIGWITIGKDKYYARKDGSLYKRLNYIGAYRYYFNETTGAMQTGFKDINGSRYYFGADGKAKIGWITIGKDKYYARKDGSLYKRLNYIGAYRYYFNETTGAMQTGFKDINGSRYYFGADGKAKIGWITIGKDKYYARKDGSLYRGWNYIGAYRYYFDKDGKLTEKTIISGDSLTTVSQMVRYYKKSGHVYPNIYKTKGAANIEEFCKIYYEEASAEGIRAEVAFCQAMKETGWLQFGGDVAANQCNFAGLGATGVGDAGVTFKDVRTGVRAQIQHLKAYANSKALLNTCVDPRFQYVTRGSAPYVEWLEAGVNPSGTGWALAANYGTSIVEMINKLLAS